MLASMSMTTYFKPHFFMNKLNKWIFEDISLRNEDSFAGPLLHTFNFSLRKESTYF